MKIIYACFRLWKRPFCCRRQTIFNKKHHLQLWLSKINKNHHFGSILTQNWEKQQQRAPKSFICNETHPLQVIQAHDYTFRQVFNFHDLCSTGPNPLFNLRPNSFIVSTKVNHSSWTHLSFFGKNISRQHQQTPLTSSNAIKTPP